jgi:spore protease
MNEKRTDLAAEARDLWRESAGAGVLPDGVAADTETVGGYTVETLRVLDERGAEALGKPVGTYITVELGELLAKEEGAFARGAELLASRLRSLLGPDRNADVLVAGLGNSAITPDDLGPRSADYVLATRHLTESLPEHFGFLRRVSVVKTGVCGVTGVESAEMVRALVSALRPSAVIAVDALASRRLGRVCRTVQLSDAGIIPGSGVGNSRAELSLRTLSVPVIAVGVPTVVDAATLAADLAEMANIGKFDSEDFGSFGRSMIVTPREIDARIEDISKLIGYALNLALQDELSVADITQLLS